MACMVAYGSKTSLTGVKLLCRPLKVENLILDFQPINSAIPASMYLNSVSCTSTQSRKIYVLRIMHILLYQNFTREVIKTHFKKLRSSIMISGTPLNFHFADNNDTAIF